MNTRMTIWVLLLVTVFGGVQRVWAADMNAWVDRTQVGEGETVQLTLEVQGQVNERPDTTPLEQDFEILGQSTGSRVNIINGYTDARTSWTLTLSPRHEGRLVIPALQAGKYRSEPLSLEVSQAPAPAPASGSDADILIESKIEPRNPYVQGQVLYTLRLLYAVQVSGGQLSDPGAEHALVQRLGEDREYTTMRNGRRYQVVERRFALFPQTSGSLELPAPVFDGEIPDTSRRRASPLQRFFGNDPFFDHDPFEDLMTPTRRVRVRGEPARLEVRPRPGAAQGAHWLPAEHVELKGTWQPESAGVQVGEPVTLVLDLEAEGLTAGQLPTPAPETVAGFRVYPDQAQRQTATADTGVTGHLQQKIAFIPERAGDLALPAVELHWWDTQADRERTASLPGRVIKVMPVAGQSPQDTVKSAPAMAPPETKVQSTAPDVAAPESQAGKSPRPDTASSSLWPVLSVLLAIGWLVTLAIWWWRTRRGRVVSTVPQPEASIATATARKQFRVACRNGDAPGARRALLAWAALHWPADPPHGLEALAQRIRHAEVRDALAELDRALYREAGNWNGTRLANCLRELPEPDAQAGTDKAVLAPLYPDTARRVHG